MSRGRGVPLREGFEQPCQAFGLDADTRVAHGKVQVQQRMVLGLIRFGREQFDLNEIYIKPFIRELLEEYKG